MARNCRKKDSGNARKKALKEAAFNHYGRFCKCSKCPLRHKKLDIALLQLDHIANDGYKYPKNIRKSLYAWARDNHYPPTLQTLCANCNAGKLINGGTCPHTGKRKHK